MAKVKELWALLEGKKAYIGLVAGAVYFMLIQTGVVAADPIIWAAITTWTGFSFRAAIK